MENYFANYNSSVESYSNLQRLGILKITIIRPFPSRICFAAPCWDLVSPLILLF
jgi:hypothetical protein